MINSKYQLLAIGTSAGGVQALRNLLQDLPKTFDIPIVIVQHLPPSAKLSLDLVFDRYTSYKIAEVEDKMPLESGKIYFAPPNYHMLVERTASISLTQDDPVNYSRPSIDVLFESVAEAYGPRAVAVLMTGANHDGAQGLLKIHESGGFTIVQSPESCEAPAMPESALNLFDPDIVADLSALGSTLERAIEVPAHG